MKIANLVVIAAYVYCMASFSWAMRSFFVKSDQRFNLEQRLILYLGTISAVLQITALFLAPPLAMLPLVLAVLCCLASFAVFLVRSARQSSAAASLGV
jgi:hypothetical protein